MNTPNTPIIEKTIIIARMKKVDEPRRINIVLLLHKKYTHSINITVVNSCFTCGQGECALELSDNNVA